MKVMKSNIQIRMSDNVLSEEEFGYATITFINDRIIEIHETVRSCYEWTEGPTIGWNSFQLFQWLRESDNIGNHGKHPEYYNQIRIPGGRWVTLDEHDGHGKIVMMIKEVEV